jgi:hypothetical protein
MKFYNFLNEEDIIQKGLNIPEPKIGGSYPEEKVKRYLDIIDSALTAMKNKEENEANDAIVQDLRDKKKKWSNVDKETKPVKTKQEIPPEQQDQEMPPEQQQESTIKRMFEGKMRLEKKDSKASKIVNRIVWEWEDWYFNDMPIKELTKELKKDFKITDKQSKYIIEAWTDFKLNKINMGELRDFIHMILQGQKYSGF